MNPMSPAERSSSRTANTRMIENATAREEVRRRRAPCLGAQVRVAENEAEALLELGPHARLRAVRRRRPRCGLLDLADPEDEEAGADEADRVDEDRIGRGEDLDQDARRTPVRRSALRGGDLELRVALDDLIPLDERRQVRLVGDVEEDGADAHEEADDVELPERERVEDVRDRDRAEEHRAAEVPGDEDSAADACGRPTRLPGA